MVLSSFLPVLVNPGVAYAASPFTKLATQPDFPASTLYATGVAFRHDSTYMAVTHASGLDFPRITIYKRDGDTFTELGSQPDVQPAGEARGVAFSHDSAYLAVAHSDYPYITIYKRSGDTFTVLINPIITVQLPSSYGLGVAFSPDSTYLAVTTMDSPYIWIYERSGDTFTLVMAPAGGNPTGRADGVAFSPDSTFLAVAHYNSPYITIYKTNGGGFNKLDNPADLPTNTGWGVAFNPDSDYMAVATANSPYILIYKRSGDNFTKLDNPNVLPGGSGNGVAFSPGSRYMAVASGPGATRNVTIYSRSGDSFTKLDDVAPTTGHGVGVAFSPVSTYMAVTVYGSPYATIYEYPPAAPTVTNAFGATNITDSTATLNGDLTSDGGDDNTTVDIYLGTTDGGQTTNWDRFKNLGETAMGDFSEPMTGLTPRTTYYYRCYATNSAGPAWAPESSSFVTQSVWAAYWAGPGKDWWRFSSGIPK